MRSIEEMSAPAKRKALRAALYHLCAIALAIGALLGLVDLEAADRRGLDS